MKIRTSTFAAVIIALISVIGSSPVRSDQTALSVNPVREWNELALDTVRLKSAIDARAARLYAMVNVAMYDAVNGIVSQHGARAGREHALVPPIGAPPEGDPSVAASAAAHAVLAGEFPDQAAVYSSRLQNDLAAFGAVGRSSVAEAWGASVGAQVRAARANDGSGPNQTQPGSPLPGQFRASWSEVQFRNLGSFGIANPSIYVGSGPPALDSLDYAGAFAEVKLVGNSFIVDAGKLATFQYWSLGNGTSQPPGAWIQVALAVTDRRPLPLPEMARLFALLSVAMSDTVAPTYQTKWLRHHWRPNTAIREADADGNLQTGPDPSWAPRAGSPGGSPEYWSGHSSFSAAGAVALAGFFCNDDIPFTLVTDSAPGGVARTYPSFSTAMAEAGRSRVVGGLHFEFSNQDGLAAGRAIASEILATRLLRRDGPTHFGRCPL